MLVCHLQVVGQGWWRKGSSGDARSAWEGDYHLERVISDWQALRDIMKSSRVIALLLLVTTNRVSLQAVIAIEWPHGAGSPGGQDCMVNMHLHRQGEREQGKK